VEWVEQMWMSMWTRLVSTMKMGLLLSKWRRMKVEEVSVCIDGRKEARAGDEQVLLKDDGRRDAERADDKDAARSTGNTGPGGGGRSSRGNGPNGPSVASKVGKSGWRKQITQTVRLLLSPIVSC
jgi:hypothetical protein